MRYILSFLILIAFFPLKAQQGSTYGLFFKDQYIINPAAAGLKDFAVVTLNHRQQWIGIEDAPVTNTLLFHLPTGDKVSIGSTIVNDTRGLLSTNSFDATIVYRLPLSKDNHNIRFGLTAGLGMNRLDVSRLDNTTSQDPALLLNMNNNLFLRGKFGLNYNYKLFNLGFVMPSLFEQKVTSSTEFADIVLDPLSTFTAFANIKIPLGDQFAFEPSVIYRMFDHGSQYEVAAVFHALDVIWLGASYRQDSGPNGLFGLTLSDRIDLGYVYEMASNQVTGFANGTHELQLTIRVGKKRVQKEVKPKPKPAPPVEPPVEVAVIPPPKKPAPLPGDTVLIDTTNNNKIRLIIEPLTPPVDDKTPETVYEPSVDDNKVYKRGTHLLELPAGHYVMVGAFESFENAQSYSDRLFVQGYHNTSFGYLSAKKLYYVWIQTQPDANRARIERDKARAKTVFKNAWYMLIED